MIADNLAAAPAPKRKGFWSRVGSLDYAYSAGAMVLLLAIWQALVVIFRVPVFLLPAPVGIAGALWTYLPQLLINSYYTLIEVLAGFILSVIVGVPLAMGLVSSKLFEKSFYPLLVGSQVVPKVAIAPLFMVWFGFGTTPKVLIAFLIAFFPIVIDSVVGLRSVELEKLYLLRSMGASPLQMFLKVRLPNALPYIFGGMKVAITLAVVGAVVGEFLGADKGIGRVLILANGSLDTELLFAGITMLTIMGVVLFLIVDMAERMVIPWHVSRRGDLAPAADQG